MKSVKTINWFPKPQIHDYPAALSYLSLIYDETKSKSIISKLKKAPMVQFKSKDIFRASSLSLLGISNFHVKNVRQKIKDGDNISPLLLVRDSMNGRVIIADGYHRLCAVYSYDEDAIIPCKIV